MKTAFLSNTSAKTQPSTLLLPQPHPEQDHLQIIVVSSPDWVTETIRDLHRLRFAEVRAWSRLLPTAHPG